MDAPEDIDEIIIAPLDLQPIDPKLIQVGEETSILLLPSSIEPPYFLMSTIAFEQEIRYFTTSEGLPVYATNGTSFQLIGNMMPELDTIFRAKFLGTGITFVNENGEEKDLSDPENLIRFITIKWK